MIKWIFEDAFHSIIAFLLIAGTVYICMFLGEFPTFVVVIMLLLFWLVAIFGGGKLLKRWERWKTGKNSSSNSTD